MDSPDLALLAGALEAAVVGSTEMAGFLSRWDRWYLKSYEAMAGHRFKFTTFATEPNVWGTNASGRGTVLRRLGALTRAAQWLRERTGRQLIVEGPMSPKARRSPLPRNIDVRVVEGSSEHLLLPSGSVDLVLTDPPYHDDVQYGELSLPFRTWAGLSCKALLREAVVNEALGHTRAAVSTRDYCATSSPKLHAHSVPVDT
jgi:putative DNA methylase